MKSRKLERFGFIATIILAMAFIVYAMDVSAASANEYNISDAVKLQKFLTCQTTLTAKEAQALDIDQNKKLSAVDLTLLKRILIYGEPQQQETTTTLSETTTTETTTTTTTTSETTTISNTSEPETTTETTITPEEEYPPKREKITDPDGNVIPEDTYNTLVEYAEKYNVKKYSIVWTNKEVIADSLFVIGAEDEKEVKCKGAFWITSGEKFYQEHKDLFELDPTFTAQDYKSVRQWPYICWRQCDDAFVTEHPDNMLYFFTFNGEEADTKFFYGKYDGSNYGEWALVPKKTTISRRDVTNPDGAIIPEATFNTLVEFAQENGIEDYDIKWTGGEMIPNSVIVIGNKSITSYMCEGAFWIYRGVDFCEMVIDYLDPEEDSEEIDDLTNREFVAWRHCDEEYMEKYPYIELNYFYDGGTDIRYFKWTQYEEDVYWALIPK